MITLQNPTASHIKYDPLPVSVVPTNERRWVFSEEECGSFEVLKTRLSFFPAAPSSYSVHQTPPSLIKSPGQSVLGQIYCSHSIPNYDNILWYKQDGGGALKYLGYLNLQHLYPENDVKEILSFSGDGRTHSNLSFVSVSQNDSAVYFCAARRAQYSRSSRRRCKNPADMQPRPATAGTRGDGWRATSCFFMEMKASQNPPHHWVNNSFFYEFLIKILSFHVFYFS